MRLHCTIQHQREAEIHYQLETATALGYPLLIREGLLLTVSHLTPTGGSAFDFEIDNPPVHFGFIMAGRNSCTYKTGTFRHQQHVIEQGSNTILCLPKTRGNVECDPVHGVSVLSILVTPDFLRTYLQDDMEAVPVQLRHILEGKPEQMLWRGRPRPFKTTLLQRILACPDTGPARALFLESAVLELIGHQLHEYCAGSEVPTPEVTLRGDERDRLRMARQRLVHDLENPPSLGQLARDVGLSEKKLKYGFRVVFGSPVYAYFRDYRLDRARSLLQDDHLSVSEAAYAVGYLNLSHFSRAFRLRYGVNPSEFCRRSTIVVQPRQG